MHKNKIPDGCEGVQYNIALKTTHFFGDRLLCCSKGNRSKWRPLRLGTSMTVGPRTNKSEPPDNDGQQRDNDLSGIHQ